jgi:PAS domain S-box-containing protein
VNVLEINPTSQSDDPNQQQSFRQKFLDSDSRLRAIVNTTVDGILSIDDHGIIEWLNPAAERIFGYSSAELIGQNVNMLMPSPYREEHDQYLANYCNTGRRKVIGIGREVVGRRKDGGTFPLDLAVSEVQLEGRRIFTGIMRDITKRKQGEALQQAKDAAEAASKAKDKLIAVLSHELRTPLTPGLLTLQMMENDPTLSANQRESLQMVRRNVELEARLIDDLLDLTRIAKGKMELHMVPVDLHDIQRRVGQICECEIEAKQLVLNVGLKAQQHHVRGDATRLQQILWNLLKNAVKFTPVGGTITVRTENPAKDRVALTVRDTGIGIKSDLLPRIFTAFEQGESARHFGGLGLGLAISKQLTELHGGILTVQSEGKDKGATFTLELETCPEEKKVASHPSLFDRYGPQKGGRILLVEDHPDTSLAMSRLLKGFGYQVRIADTVASALQFAATERFDAVISDIDLPDGSGLDLMGQLKGKRLLKGIAVSGFGMQDDIRKSMEAGFSAHLTKPVTVAALERVLREICG